MNNENMKYILSQYKSQVSFLEVIVFMPDLHKTQRFWIKRKFMNAFFFIIVFVKFAVSLLNRLCED